MNLNELEQQVLSIEGEQIISQAQDIIVRVPDLIKDIDFVRTQLDKLG